MKKFIVSLFSLLAIAASGIAQECDAPGTVTATVRLVRKPNTLLFGQFTVDEDGHKVSFSKGNLQYDASAAAGSKWSFAASQLTYIGNAAGNTTKGESRATQSALIDLFGYGTSGQGLAPYDTIKNSASYYAGNLVGEGQNYDWGVKNFTVDVDAGYRVLTDAEWTYLLTERANYATRRGLATVNGVKGLVLLPDDWVAPAGVTFTINMSDYGSAVTAADWEKMEDAGAVFLPAAGQREGEKVSDAGTIGYYWSSTSGKGVRITAGSAASADITAEKGCSVRLVQTL